MNRHNGIAPACASCKQQRRKCYQGCEMAPYFPASRFEEFRLAHRLFGMSNIVKLMNYVEPHQKSITAESLLMEARLRAENPPRGCLGIVKDLKSQIKSAEDELTSVQQQLALIRKPYQKKNKVSDLNQLPSDSNEKDDGYNYQTTLEEALAAEHFHITCLIPIMESNTKIDPETIANIKKRLDDSSEIFKKDKGKRPMEYSGEEEEEEED